MVGTKNIVTVKSKNGFIYTHDIKIPQSVILAIAIYSFEETWQRHINIDRSWSFSFVNGRP
jgi:hypothetical protein